MPSVGPTATVFDRYAFDEIKIEWNELTYNESRGTVFEYNVVYYAVSVNGEDVIPSDYDRQSIWVDYPIHNLTVTNLQPFTKYAFELAALTYPGVGAYANPVYGGNFCSVPSNTLFTLQFYYGLSEILYLHFPLKTLDRLKITGTLFISLTVILTNFTALLSKRRNICATVCPCVYTVHQV